MKRPSFQFYPSDFLNDINIKSATLEERGFLVCLMCLMHQNEPYGYLSKEFEANLPRLLGEDRRTCARLLANLQAKFLISRNAKNGLLMNKRMVRDEEIRAIRSHSGSLGGSPLLKQKVKQAPNLTVEDEEEDEKEEEDNKDNNNKYNRYEISKKLKEVSEKKKMPQVSYQEIKASDLPF